MNKTVTLNFDPNVKHPDEIDVSAMHKLVSTALTAESAKEMESAAGGLMEIQSRCCKHIATLCDINHDISQLPSNSAITQHRELISAIEFIARIGISCAAVNEGVARSDMPRPNHKQQGAS